MSRPAIQGSESPIVTPPLQIEDVRVGRSRKGCNKYHVNGSLRAHLSFCYQDEVCQQEQRQDRGTLCREKCH